MLWPFLKCNKKTSICYLLIYLIFYVIDKKEPNLIVFYKK